MRDRKKKKNNPAPEEALAVTAEAEENIPEEEAATEAEEPAAETLPEAESSPEPADKAAPEEEAPAGEAPAEEITSEEEPPAEGEAEEEEEEPEEESEEEEEEEEEADQVSDELAYKVLGPQSVFAQLVQLLIGTVPIIGAPLILLWAFFGGTTTSVALVSAPSALALAVMAFWACGGCANVNRRRFARAYFLWILVTAALLAIIGLLAVSFGFQFSPVLKKLLTPYL